MRDKRILLVEDDPNDEMLVRHALEKCIQAGAVCVARDGAEALEWLFATGRHVQRDPRDLPGVVLLDLKLPKLDGLEVLRHIRENALTRKLPVVILTSSAEEKDIDRSYELGANSYVRKPVEFERFMDAMGCIARYWLQINNPAG